MNILIEQEIALHQYEIRQNQAEVIRLLHPTFREIGLSGKSYDFDSIVEIMKNEQPSDGYIHSQDFESIQLEPSIQLLLYKSALVDMFGKKSHFAKRLSIWIFIDESWQMKYHQATPCSEFEFIDSEFK